MRHGRPRRRAAASRQGTQCKPAGPGLRGLHVCRAHPRTRPDRAGLVLATATTLLAGCATLAAPSSPHQLEGPNRQGADQGQAYPQLIPVPPGKDWSAENIVAGFLVASASFANGHAIARQYLGPTAARQWKPDRVVTVVGQPQVSQARLVPAQSAGGPLTTTVRVTGQQLATLTRTGQLLPLGGRVSEDFLLTKESGQWRITNPPARLLLTPQTFLDVYQPRNLYFIAPSGPLVPDPVFVPQQATETSFASDLVRALLPPGPPEGSWLFRAVRTSFPAGTRLLAPVRLDGTLATVNLGGAAAATSRDTRDRMAAQLVWTLTSQSYTPSPIKSVVLQINGRPQRIHGATSQLLRNYQASVPAQAAQPYLYFTGTDRVLRELSPGGQVRPLPGAARAIHGRHSAIAVSPSGKILAASASWPRGCYIETAGIGKNPPAFTRHLFPGSPCTSLSWDSSGDLWAAAGRVVWMLPPQASPERLNTGLPGRDSVRVFRVARDGARAVMIVRSRSGRRQVLVASIVRDGPAPALGGKATVGGRVAGPADVAWHGPDHLMVLSGCRSAAQLIDVPLNGEPGTAVPAPPGCIVAMTAAGSSITVAGSDGHLLTSASPGQPWRQVGSGSLPAAYPG